MSAALELERKRKLIQNIINAISAGGGYITGELAFMLAFRTENELKQICAELNIASR